MFRSRSAGARARLGGEEVRGLPVVVDLVAVGDAGDRRGEQPERDEDAERQRREPARRVFGGTRSVYGSLHALEVALGHDVM